MAGNEYEGDTTPQHRATALKLMHEALRGSGVAGPMLLSAAGAVFKAFADAGLLCSSPVVRPEEDGSPRSLPSAAGRHDVYVRVTNEQVHRTSCHSDNTVNVDLDGDGVPVGIEVLNVIGLEIDGHPVNLAALLNQESP